MVVVCGPEGGCDGLVKICLVWAGSAPLDENRAGNGEGYL